MINVRNSGDRGVANFGWLDSRHSFSFGHYHDPRHMGFGPLRVINEDKVAPGGGFDEHGHRDMEIFSYVLEGALAHKDSLGTGSVIKPGDLQRMSAGSGIRHSEFNASQDHPVHFLQIWIVPEAAGIAPSYEQASFPQAERQNRLRLVAARSPRDGALKVHQDVELSIANVDAGAAITHALKPDRSAWVQVVAGDITLNGTRLRQGDGAAIAREATLAFQGVEGKSEFLLFDMAAKNR